MVDTFYSTALSRGVACCSSKMDELMEFLCVRHMTGGRVYISIRTRMINQRLIEDMNIV
jgi:hypothetical protein